MTDQKESAKPSLHLRTLLLQFNLPLYTRQLPQWRGAFIEMAGWTDDRFHNHRNDRGDLRYRYPLIQYRVRRRKAALFAVNEGVEALQGVLASSDWQLPWRGQTQPLMVEDLRMQEHELTLTDRPRTYKLYKYLALNNENFERWRRADGLIERTQLLERVLRGHLLSCMWGLGWAGDQPVQVRILEMRKTQYVPFKGRQQLAFDLVYTANVALPPQIALGRVVSHGFGWQAPADVGRMTRPVAESRQRKTTARTGAQKI